MAESGVCGRSDCLPVTAKLLPNLPTAGAAGDGAGVPISLPKLAAGQAKRLTAVTGTSVSLPAKPTKKPAVSAPARVLALAGAAKSNSGTAGGVLGVGMSDLLAGLEAA